MNENPPKKKKPVSTKQILEVTRVCILDRRDHDLEGACLVECIALEPIRILHSALRRIEHKLATDVAGRMNAAVGQGKNRRRQSPSLISCAPARPYVQEPLAEFKQGVSKRTPSTG